MRQLRATAPQCTSSATKPWSGRTRASGCRERARRLRHSRSGTRRALNATHTVSHRQQPYPGGSAPAMRTNPPTALPRLKPWSDNPRATAAKAKRVRFPGAPHRHSQQRSRPGPRVQPARERLSVWANRGRGSPSVPASRESRMKRLHLSPRKPESPPAKGGSGCVQRLRHEQTRMPSQVSPPAGVLLFVGRPERHQHPAPPVTTQLRRRCCPTSARFRRTGGPRPSAPAGSAGR